MSLSIQQAQKVIAGTPVNVPINARAIAGANASVNSGKSKMSMSQIKQKLTELQKKINEAQNKFSAEEFQKFQQFINKFQALIREYDEKMFAYANYKKSNIQKILQSTSKKEEQPQSNKDNKANKDSLKRDSMKLLELVRRFETQIQENNEQLKLIEQRKTQIHQKKRELEVSHAKVPEINEFASNQNSVVPPQADSVAMGVDSKCVSENLYALAKKQEMIIHKLDQIIHGMELQQNKFAQDEDNLIKVMQKQETMLVDLQKRIFTLERGGIRNPHKSLDKPLLESGALGKRKLHETIEDNEDGLMKSQQQNSPKRQKM